MKIQMELTGVSGTLDDVYCRLWKGATASGIEVIVAVRGIMIPNEADRSRFECEFKQAECVAISDPTLAIVDSLLDDDPDWTCPGCRRRTESLRSFCDDCVNMRDEQ